MKCNVCGTSKLREVRYDLHVPPENFLGRLKYRVKLFRYPYIASTFSLIESYIPSNLKSLKKISRWFANPFGGKIKVCQSCGHGEMMKPPNLKKLESYYRDMYWDAHSNRPENVTVSETKKNNRAGQQIDFVYQTLSDNDIKSILEIGAGEASAILLLRTRLASKPDLFVCESGKQWEDYYKTAEIHKIADYFPFTTERRFSYIHTSHWLEHTRDLIETITILKNLLNENGFLFIEVPNTKHDYWDNNFLDTPHIHFFTPSSLKKVFENYGFKCNKIATYGPTNKDLAKGNRQNAVSKLEIEGGCWIRALFSVV